MSREEAIAFFKDMNECTYGNIEAVEMAIKALEQDTVSFDFELYQAGLMDMPKGVIDMLDEIRAEIVNLTNGDTPERIWNVDVLNIIDKYKESENKE
jgi:hypothetical protein